MVASKRHNAPTTAEAGRKGALSLHRAMSPERRREIAIAASRSALLKRRGMFTTRELTRAYIARLRAEDPELARFVALALQAPAKYADGLVAILPPDQREVANRAYEATFAEATQ
jgi:Asp-tRNA(Asn)/Glu-tRNA(Gln) amidotransferase A subunit family amidase